MEVNEMTLEQIEARRLELTEESNALSDEAMSCADVERLTAIDERASAIAEERQALREREEAINKAAEERAARIADVINHGTESRHNPQEDKKVEVRNTPEYINAFAEYIKTGRDAECRALLTDNANGRIPVPEYVEEIVRSAWEREDIMSRVRKSYVKGNLKVGFEMSSDGARVHDEGDDAIPDEELVLGIVTMVPQSIKKMLHISDEVYDLRGEAFLRYIYDELTHQIAKKTADTLVTDIATLPAASANNRPAAAQVSAAPAVGVIAQAIGLLSDEATAPVVIMNKATWSAFKSAAYAASYGVDPFEGLPVLFNNSLPAYSAASAGAVYAIVGDLERGALANFPNGEDITIKFDDLSEAEADLIKIVGRQFVAVAAVTPNAFVNIKKA